MWRVCALQQKIPHTATKTRGSQINNKNIYTLKKTRRSQCGWSEPRGVGWAVFPRLPDYAVLSPGDTTSGTVHRNSVEIKT